MRKYGILIFGQKYCFKSLKFHNRTDINEQMVTFELNQYNVLAQIVPKIKILDTGIKIKLR